LIVLCHERTAKVKRVAKYRSSNQGIAASNGPYLPPLPRETDEFHTATHAAFSQKGRKSEEAVRIPGCPNKGPYKGLSCVVSATLVQCTFVRRWFAPLGTASCCPLVDQNVSDYISKIVKLVDRGTITMPEGLRQLIECADFENVSQYCSRIPPNMLEQLPDLLSAYPSTDLAWSRYQPPAHPAADEKRVEECRQETRQHVEALREYFANSSA
jgi:hypothetical protein